MELMVSNVSGVSFLEGSPRQACMRRAEDAVLILEECLRQRVDRILLYAENLPERFFDLSSGEAGAILQMFRNYAIRLAVVWSPGTRRSRRFDEMVREENRGSKCGFFDTRESACTWLAAA